MPDETQPTHVLGVNITDEHLAKGLKAVVQSSSQHVDVRHSIHAHLQSLESSSVVRKLIPGLEHFAVKHHVGNDVVIRSTGGTFFESMPIYARIGMHLLFYGKERTKILGSSEVEHLLEEQSKKQGEIYDSLESAKSIPSFVELYELQTDELLITDLNKYKSFNEFFYRKLRADARPVQHLDDPTNLCSAADCRLTVYSTIDLAREFWIKGRNFTIPKLLNIPATSEKAISFDGAAIAIFRLAPADYHRFHSPLDGEVGEVVPVPGQYYTVNPQVVNEKDFDVFTANTRSILYLTHSQTGAQVAFVAIGALLVGSIKWTAGGKKGATVKRGDELGYFAYGGSTVVVVFPKGMLEFDKDLVANSEKPIETLMKVGYSLGRVPPTFRKAGA